MGSACTKGGYNDTKDIFPWLFWAHTQWSALWSFEILSCVWGIGLTSSGYWTVVSSFMWRATEVTSKTTVVRIHNIGFLRSPSNYRPINCIAVISGMMIKGQLTLYLLSHGLINAGHHGFLWTKTCNTCLADFVNLAMKSASDGKPMIAIFIDIPKAFDRAPHHKPLTEVEGHGVVYPVVAWFSSYLILCM